ncbi:photosynthetic protein synthase I [Campylobacter pinnipediorum subsp. pinnipediorum]|uniref:SCO family protein n=1 Tax=Campylobacter pinnipediorum TaxID=1965231 RepID=UPI000995B5FE|nr:SCO family protein [Campylobacter pinnipediorum]OPA74518.1 photosynthetic protein synthase I [Campylobacter pinnipediorum subsp. pinnipediorum]
MKKIISILTTILILIAFVLFINKEKANKYDFVAQTQNKEIKLRDLDGEYKILYFGYLFCPDVCPATLFRVSEVLSKINRQDIKLLFATLDKERDTPEQLQEMVSNFYNNSLGIKMKDLDKVAKAYNVKYKKIQMPDSAIKYSIAHSSAIYLLDKNGGLFTEVSNLTEEDITQAIQDMIKQRP